MPFISCNLFSMNFPYFTYQLVLYSGFYFIIVKYLQVVNYLINPYCYVSLLVLKPNSYLGIRCDKYAH